MIQVTPVIDQTALSDFMREMAGAVKTALISATGRDVNVTTGLDAGIWTLHVASGVSKQIRIISMVNGVIPVMRADQVQNDQQSSVVDGVIKKAISQVWPRFVKRVIRVTTSNT